jgi:hypothetical protein
MHIEDTGTKFTFRGNHWWVQHWPGSHIMFNDTSKLAKKS